MAKKAKARGKGFGTLVAKNGGWMGRWKVNGKLHSQMLKDPDGNAIANRRDAEKALEDLTAPYRLADAGETAAMLATRAAGVQAEIAAWKDKQPALPIAKAFDAYRASTTRPRRAGEDALATYEGFYNDLVEWLKDNRPDYTELRQVTEADADAYTAHFLEHLTAGTWGKHLTLLKCLWRTLMVDDARKGDPAPGELPKAKLTCNPWAAIQKPPHEVQSHRVLTMEELVRVCGSVKGEMRTLFAVGVYSGLRLGDASLLRWEEVDLATRYINRRPRKTKKYGTTVRIPIHAALAAVLEEIPPRKRKGFVTPTLADLYLRDDAALSRKVQRVFEDCGITTTMPSSAKDGKAITLVGYHSLRHGFVSLQGNAGVSLALVQSMVGHTSEKVTGIYFHSNDLALRHAVDTIPNVITGGGAVATMTDSADLAEFRRLWERMGEADRARVREIVAG